MSTFVPVLNEQHGMKLSRALWDLASPPALRSPGNGTTHYCGVVEDANGAWWLEIEGGFDLSVSPLADAALFDAAVNEIERTEDAP